MNATRPDFPVRAGQFLGTPSRRQASFPHAEAVHARLSLSPRPETNYDSLVIRVCRPGTTHCLPRCCFCVPSNDATIRSRRATAQGFLMSVPPPAHALDEVAQKWRALAERRCAHFLELRRSGRWRHYYGEARFLDHLREAIRLSARWAEIAPPSMDEAAALALPVADGRPPTAA